LGKTNLSLAALREGDNRHVTLVTGFLLEFHDALAQRKERVVLANSDVVAGIVLGAALANDDGAGRSGLTTKDFHTQSLGC